MGLRDLEGGVGKNTFPKQEHRIIGVDIVVRFQNEKHISNCVKGKFVRYDVTFPWISIIQLEDGRFILDEECNWHTKQNNEEIISLQNKIDDLKDELSQVYSKNIRKIVNDDRELRKGVY